MIVNRLNQVRVDAGANALDRRFHRRISSDNENVGSRVGIPHRMNDRMTFTRHSPWLIMVLEEALTDFGSIGESSFFLFLS